MDDVLTSGPKLITSKLRYIKPASPTVQTLAVLQAQIRSMKSFMNSPDNHHSHSPISQRAYVVLTTASINTDPLSRATTGHLTATASLTNPILSYTFSLILSGWLPTLSSTSLIFFFSSFSSSFPLSLFSSYPSEWHQFTDQHKMIEILIQAATNVSS